MAIGFTTKFRNLFLNHSNLRYFWCAAFTGTVKKATLRSRLTIPTCTWRLFRFEKASIFHNDSNTSNLVYSNWNTFIFSCEDCWYEITFLHITFDSDPLFYRLCNFCHCNKDCFPLVHTTKVLELHHYKRLHHSFDVLDAYSSLLSFGHSAEALALFSSTLGLPLFRTFILRSGFFKLFYQTSNFQSIVPESGVTCCSVFGLFLGIAKSFCSVVTLFSIYVICLFHVL